MFIKSNDKSTNIIKGNVIRRESIEHIIKSGEHKGIIDKLFTANDYDRFDYILRNELFYEDIHKHFSKVLFDNIKNISKENFTLELEISPGKDLFSVMVMLDLI